MSVLFNIKKSFVLLPSELNIYSLIGHSSFPSSKIYILSLLSNSKAIIDINVSFKHSPLNSSLKDLLGHGTGISPSNFVNVGNDSFFPLGIFLNISFLFKYFIFSSKIFSVFLLGI